MAKQILTQVWCDNTDAHPEEPTPGDTYRVAIDGPPMELDFCADCAATLVTPLKNLLQTYGQPLPVGPAKGRTRKAAPGPGVLCPQCTHTANSVSSLRSHMLSQHGSSKGAGDALPVPASEPQVAVVKAVTCPECGEGYESASKLRRHLRGSHSILASGDVEPTPEGMYPCPECGREWTTKAGMGRHRASAHPSEHTAGTLFASA